MNKNIRRIMRELEKDPVIQAMHRDNIEKRQALRERRRALMLARMHKHNVVAVIDQNNDQKIKKEAIKQAIREKYNGDTFKAVVEYLPHAMEGAFTGKFSQEFDDLFHEAVIEMNKEKEEEEKEEEEVYILSNGKKTNDFLEWAQDRIDARKAAAK